MTELECGVEKEFSPVHWRARYYGVLFERRAIYDHGGTFCIEVLIWGKKKNYPTLTSAKKAAVKLLEAWKETALMTNNVSEISKPEGWSKCNNCEWEGIPETGLSEVPDLLERIEPGEIVPSGECPECGAL